MSTTIGQNFFQKHFLFSNRFILLVMGLLPHQNSKNQFFVISLIIIYGIPGLFHQFYQLATYDYSVETTVKILQKVLTGTFMICGYTNTYFSFSTMRLLFNTFKTDCEHLSNDEELNIMEKYTRQIKLYCYGIIFVFSLYFISIVSPSILNIILYLFGILDGNKLTLVAPVNNVPRPGTFFFILFIYQTIGCSVAMIIGTVYYVTYLVFVQHACYQFSIIILKVQKLSIKKEEYTETVLNETITWKEHDWIIDIIKNYKQVTEYIDLLNKYSNIVYLIDVVFAMIFVIFDFFYIFRMSEILQSTGDTIECSFIVAASILLLYLNFYIGQKLLNHSNETYEELRTAPFYKLSVKSQKLLLFIITRSMKQSGLSIGGMFVSSNEVFAGIMRKAFSFATVYSSAT